MQNKLKIVIHRYPFSYYGDKVFAAMCCVGDLFNRMFRHVKNAFCFIGSKMPFDIDIQ